MFRPVHCNKWTIFETNLLTPKNKYIFYYNIPVSFGFPLYKIGSLYKKLYTLDSSEEEKLKCKYL